MVQKRNGGGGAATTLRRLAVPVGIGVAGGAAALALGKRDRIAAMLRPTSRVNDVQDDAGGTKRFDASAFEARRRRRAEGRQRRRTT